MTCARCATINPDGATVCATCGAPLIAGMAPPSAASYMQPPGYPPPGYPPQGYMPYGAQMTPQRSGIPKTVGIIMIVFASLGMLLTLANLGGPKDEGVIDPEAFEKLKTMAKVFGVVDLLVGVLHLVAGIRLAGYKKNGPTLAFTYGIVKIVSTVIQLIVVYAWLMPALDKLGADSHAKALVGGMFVFALVISAVWPVIVMALVTRPAAKASCA